MHNYASMYMYASSFFHMVKLETTAFNYLQLDYEMPYLLRLCLTHLLICSKILFKKSYLTALYLFHLLLLFFFDGSIILALANGIHAL